MGKEKDEFKVTPWEVSGKIDYEKLIAQFGVSPIDNRLLERIKKHTGELHFMLRRQVFFAHRDLNWILDEYEKGNKFFLYTGRAPSGPVHLGHLLVWIFTKWLQDKFNVELWFQFPDEEKFLFKKDIELKDIEGWLYDNMLDVIALGFDAKKTHFLIDTWHASLMYKQACRVAKRLTLSTVKAAFGLTDEANPGQVFYTTMQAVPAFLPSILKQKNIPCLIPHAIDQDPHFRLTRDILPKLGYLKPASIQSIFLPPLTGFGKMSTTEEKSVIFTSDKPEEVEQKIRQHAFSGGQPTIQLQRKLGGNPDIDVSFQYLKILFETDDKRLEKIYNDYKSGKLLTSELKEILIEKINAFLKQHQRAKEKAKSRIERFIYKE
ncbi:MAG: tryptophan--tRNA ligase [Candidatus Pacearchaeota archaeon]